VVEVNNSEKVTLLSFNIQLLFFCMT